MPNTLYTNTAPFPIVVVGHVDHGKSTLIGRLLHDTQSLPDGKFEELKRAADKRGGVMEWSFALDSLQIERDQAITVDSTQIWFRSLTRTYVIIDAPGHAEFLRNMISGAAQAEAGIILVDVVQGVTDQTRRHAYLLKLLGVTRVIVAINKMDLVDYNQNAFLVASNEIAAYLKTLGLEADHIVPVAARQGENLIHQSSELPWWQGPSLVEALDSVPERIDQVGAPLRLPIQDVYRRDQRRILVGRVESGRVNIGDTITLWPTEQSARIATFEAWNVDSPVTSAAESQSVAFTLDRDLFVERGHLATAASLIPRSDRTITVRIFWLATEALRAGRRLTLKLSTASYNVIVESVDDVINVSNLGTQVRDEVCCNEIGRIKIRCESPIIYDVMGTRSVLARGVLFDQFTVVGGCVIDPDIKSNSEQQHIYLTPQSVNPQERAVQNGHSGLVVWLTGLSGSGKSTLAMALQRKLFDSGRNIYVLDGDNMRHGLSRDLRFSDKDRLENVRRTAEVAKMMAEAGLITIVSLITPTNAARELARNIVGDCFRLVYVDAKIETCRERDPKGLYLQDAIGGHNMTGVTSPWETPQQFDLRVDSEHQTEPTNTALVMNFVNASIVSPQLLNAAG